MQKRHTILRSLLIIATPYTIWIHYSDTQTVHIWTLCHIRVQYGYILHNRLTIYDHIWLHSSIQYEYILQIHRCLYGLYVIFVYSMDTYFIIDWLYMTIYDCIVVYNMNTFFRYTDVYMDLMSYSCTAWVHTS